MKNQNFTNRTFEFKIKDINKNGEGFAEINSSFNKKPYLSIPYALPNEIVEISKESHSLINIKNKSPDRIKPNCINFFKCGGCLLQHLRLSKYIEWKNNLLLKPLKIISPKTKFKNLKISPLFSRRRAKVFVKKTSSNFIVGFKSYKSNNLININECLILEPKILNFLQDIRSPLHQILNNNDEIEININLLNDGLDIVLKFYKQYDFLELNILSFLQKIKNISRISFQYKNNQTELIGKLNSGRLYLQDEKTYMLPTPGGFFQATKLAEKTILEEIFFSLGESKKLNVLDLFSGCGTISLPLLNKNYQVYSIDINEESLNNLIIASKRQNLFNKLQTQVHNLKKYKLEIDFLKTFDVVILDPPRSGAKLQISAVADAQVPKVISISCNVQTFLSDCEVLIKKGYKLKSITPIDQFLYTGHLETIGIFEI